MNNKFHFSVKLYEIQKKVMIQNCLLNKDFESLHLFITCTYIFLFNYKKYLSRPATYLNVFNTYRLALLKMYDFYDCQFVKKNIKKAHNKSKQLIFVQFVS